MGVCHCGKFGNIKLKFADNKTTDYPFSYTRKEIYDSKIIIYDNVRLMYEIPCVNKRCIPCEFIYGKLMYEPSSRSYVFLSTQMHLIHAILIHKSASSLYFNFNEELLYEYNRNKDYDDIVNAYLQIKNEYHIKNRDRIISILGKYLISDVVDIVLNYTY